MSYPIRENRAHKTRSCVFDIGDGDRLYAWWSRSGKSVGLNLWRTEPFRFAQVVFRLDQVLKVTEMLLESRPVRKPARDAPSRIVEFVDEDDKPGALRTEWHRQGERVTFTLSPEPHSYPRDPPEFELTGEQVDTLVAFLRAGP